MSDILGAAKAALNDYARHGFYPLNFAPSEALAALVSRCEAAEAEIRRRDAMVCETCRHHRWVQQGEVGWRYCDKIQNLCSVANSGCLAWEKRD